MAKRSIAAILLTLSMSTFALDNIGIHQSYYVTEKGRPVTIKSESPSSDSGFATTWSPDEFFYQKDIVDVFGGNYIVLDTDGIIHTIDSQGNMYKELDAYADSKVKIAGHNYFITRNGQIVVVKNDGSIGKTDAGFERVRESKAGGMYFFHNNKLMIPNIFSGENNELAYSTSARRAERDGVLHLDGRVKVYGDSFFITDENIVYTIGFKFKTVRVIREDRRGRRTEETETNYFPEVYKTSLPSHMNHESIAKKGGNFFMDARGNLYTIADNATLRNHGVVPGKEGQMPRLVGGNYMIFNDGSLFQVDENGFVSYVQQVRDRIIATNANRSN